MAELQEIIKSLIAGIILGSVFFFLKLPAPAPGSLSGVFGIFGIFAGYLIAKKFLSN